MTASSTATAHWDRMYETSTRSAWTQNPIVEQALYHRMTDQSGFWLEWVFTQKLSPANRVLSIGCGDGGHELMMAQRGHAQHIVAFDASPVAIEQATANARALSLNVDFSVRLFESFVADPGPANQYDVVLFSGSLHHVTDIEGMLSAVRTVLAPGGHVIVNEYCGPCYQIYPVSQVEIVNRVLDRIAPIFRMADERLTLPTIDMIMANDPTEGVRSALIPILTPMYFEPVYERFVGGGLLHPLFGYLNGAKVNDGSPESTALVQMLIALEDELTLAGALKHDFMLGIYRKP